MSIDSTVCPGLKYRLSEYAFGLTVSQRNRYIEKLKLLGVDDPYIITQSVWKEKKEFKSLLPPTRGYHITLYCLSQRESTSAEQFRCNKSLDAKDYVKKGFVQQCCGLTLADGTVIVKSHVTPSQSFNDTSRNPWVALKATGEVITGHCNCTAG